MIVGRYTKHEEVSLFGVATLKIYWLFNDVRPDQWSREGCIILRIGRQL
jgi:hypothetical protein